MKNLLYITLFCLVGGCEFPDKGVVDTIPPPFISQATASPTLIDVTHLAAQPTDAIDTTITFSATVDGANQYTLVTYIVSDPSDSLLVSGNLTVNNGGKFSANTRFHILKENVGIYNVQFQAVNNEESRSNLLTQAIIVKNSDHAPVVSNLVMPDSVTVPPAGDTTFVKITVAVSDTDGVQDIVSVSLTSRRPDNSVVGIYPMYDDGGFNAVIPFGLKSGDAVAGDGIYTLTIPLLSSTTGNTYRDFSFIATDRSGESSNVLTKRIFIQ
ncbi:MAG: hypothetical protein WBZ48_06195 [Bacteroidota bacterium]